MLSSIHTLSTHVRGKHISHINPFTVVRSVWQLVPADHSYVVAHPVKVSEFTKPSTTSEIQMSTLSIPDSPDGPVLSLCSGLFSLNFV